MSIQVFPTPSVLPGRGWSLTRTIQAKTRKQVAVSGKETALADWSLPRYQWDLVFNILRQGNINGGTWSEMATLFGFYNARNGGFDSFLYQDTNDNAVTGQAIATGNNSAQTFPLVRSLGGFVEPILAPNVVTAVYFNGVAQSSTGWNWARWDSTYGLGGAASPWSPGTLGFTTAPGTGVSITADFSYYWPCRFVDDQCAFEEMFAGVFAVKKLSFQSIK